MNPVSLSKKIGRVQLPVFYTSSTAAAIPVSIDTARNRLKVPESVSDLLIALCAIMTMTFTLISA